MTGYMALSVRQPWAWLICKGYKPVENRTWQTRFRGGFFVHAGKTMTKADYEACRIFLNGFTHIELPAPTDLLRGGIVGAAAITDCVCEFESPWFTGPFGFVIASAQMLPFRPCKGSLGFFRV